MTGGSINRIRHSKLPLAIFALICVTFASWVVVQKAEILSFFLPYMQPPDIQLPLFSLGSSGVTFSDAQHESADRNILLVDSSDLRQDSADETILPPIFSDLQNETQDKKILPPFSDAKNMSSLENISSGERAQDSSNQMRTPSDIANLSVSSSGKERDAEIELSQIQDCNYAKGKWVPDNRRPLYSGLACQPWLSRMWACRLLKRTDFSFESFRWQPQGCKMPEFSSLEFLRRMRDKTIAFVGDSLGRQQFQSLMCMVSNGAPDPVEDIGEEFGLVRPPGAKRPDGWVYRFTYTNTTILFYWSATLCAVTPLNSSDPDTHYALHLDMPVAFLSENLHRFDVLVLNSGHHWNRGKFEGNRWEMHFRGQPITDRKLAQIGNAKVLAIQNVVKWVDSQLSQYPRLKVFSRTISPRHFMNGDWNSGGTCGNTVPLTNGSEVLQDNSSDSVVEDAVKGTKVKILDITALSQLRDECHISNSFSKKPDGGWDCLHWCLPGIPDTWNEILCAQL